MAILTSTANGYFDSYGGQRYYEEQERRYREEMLRQQHRAMQAQQYDPYRQIHPGGITDQQIQEGKAPKPTPQSEPDFMSNKKLLLLEK